MNPNQANQTDPLRPFASEPIPPEMLEWARQTFDEQEFLRQMHEIEKTGGLTLQDFLAELEIRVAFSKGER
jgi:hypothetical protein